MRVLDLGSGFLGGFKPIAHTGGPPLGTTLPIGRRMKKRTNVISNESGQGLTEYLVLLILISVASITIVTQIGGAVQNRFRAAKEKIQSISVNSE